MRAWNLQALGAAWADVVKARRMLARYSTLGESRLIAKVLQKQMGWFPPGRRLFAAVERRIDRHQQQLDHQCFDQAHGTDTGGVIPLVELKITGGNQEDGVWYEPTSPLIFRQLMAALEIPFGDYEFVDFGSGKGRALLLAAEQGFRRVTGVEFAQELHEVALKNIALCQGPVVIESLHLDAGEYQVPNAPLVAFFYCPFRGPVLDQVLGHLAASHRRTAQPLVLVFVGLNSGVIAQFEAAGFSCREVELRRDATRFIHYRGLIFTPPA